MSFLHQLERSAGKILATAGVAAGLYLAPATVQAQERPREDCTLDCGTPPLVSGSPASDPTTVGTGRPARKAEPLYLTSNPPQRVQAVRPHRHPHTHAEYEAQIADLRARLEKLAGADQSYTAELRVVSETLTRLERTLTESGTVQDQILDGIGGLVTRLEGYERFRQDTERVTRDPALEYMLPIFRRGWGELGRSKDRMTKACTDSLRAYGELFRQESELAGERCALDAERGTLPGKLEAITKDSTLDAYTKAQRAEQLRVTLAQREATLAERERNAATLAAGVPFILAPCEDAKQRYDALQAEFPKRIQRNIFGRRNGSGNLVMEVGLQYGRSEVNRASVNAAVCYKGNHITVCAGAGIGKAGEATDTTDLTLPPTRERDGEYVTESSQTGTETRGSRYQWDASLRLAPRNLYFGRSSWSLTPSAIAEVAFSQERIERDLTRMTQLYRGAQPVSDPVSAHGSDTEYRTGAAFVPGAAVDLCRDLWGRESGKSLCARVGAGYDLQNERAVFTVGGLVKF